MADTATTYTAADSAFTADLAPGSLITQDGQMQWAGLLMGPGTPYAVDSTGLTGWEDLPAYDSSDANRPTSHGAWPGARHARPRTVGGALWLLPATVDAAVDTVRTLRQALALADGERWLAVRLHGETLAVRARVSRRVVPTDRQYALAGTAKASVQWVATDPRRYQVVEQSLTTGAPTAESGLTWPLTWPLDFGTAAVTGDVVADNDGSAPTHPLITFQGPCGMPTVTEHTTGRRLRYDITLTATDVLTVDTSAGTVTLNSTASRRNTATADSAPEELFAFEPGSTELSFRPDSSSAGAAMTVRWRSAEW
ncbi:phage distal tail protein [Streptomyces beihaiensis]|uniref:Phage tail family protein n=1 Tax=Streptomyces beihaiensis TaxID=2984495 RepID=A0ABT3TXY2_9ACTN|nr:phage tail domain-containing protein [Streptomyces beihaiensis]MCX3061874.1 phage tail family protein [Streptomyces beihaiensis]